MIMIDVTGVDCEEGDEVVLFVKQSTAEEFASNGNTIFYELLAVISKCVKRKSFAFFGNIAPIRTRPGVVS